MAVFCENEPCYAICDFCKHYNFNGIPHPRRGEMYVDKGCCKLHFMRSDPMDGCDYFHCQYVGMKLTF